MGFDMLALVSIFMMHAFSSFLLHNMTARIYLVGQRNIITLGNNLFKTFEFPRHKIIVSLSLSVLTDLKQ